MLIVIEGSDKAGKATQVQLLADRLAEEGFSVKNSAFPDYSTKIGEEIKAFLHSKRDYPIEVRHMLLSANRWEKKAAIESMLRSNKIVVLNRYYHSNWVYGLASGLKLEWLQSLDAGLPKEDLVVVLDVSPEVSTKRMQRKEDIFETNDDIMNNVSRLYRELAPKYNWILINGDRSKEEVHKEIFKIVEEKIKQKH